MNVNERDDIDLDRRTDELKREFEEIPPRVEVARR
jgi:hypothetical protein